MSEGKPSGGPAGELPKPDSDVPSLGQQGAPAKDLVMERDKGSWHKKILGRRTLPNLVELTYLYGSLPHGLQGTPPHGHHAARRWISRGAGGGAAGGARLATAAASQKLRNVTRFH